jgi:hypothetical protein
MLPFLFFFLRINLNHLFYSICHLTFEENKLELYIKMAIGGRMSFFGPFNPRPTYIKPILIDLNTTRAILVVYLSIFNRFFYRFACFPGFIGHFFHQLLNLLATRF